MLGILDYGMGNIFSLLNATRVVGFDAKIITCPDDLDACDALILPGVGAFQDAMLRLKENKFIDAIHSYRQSGKYVLGICLGMQLLGQKSFEFGEHNGLKVVKGNSLRFPSQYKDNNLIIPHIMWNKVLLNYELNNEIQLYKNISDKEFMYFVHSYYVEMKNDTEILSFTKYEGMRFCASYQVDNIIGVQFHPEKSGKVGLQILKNFNQMIYK